MITKSIYIYCLTDVEGNRNIVVVDSPSDNIRLYGHDKNGVYQQYDSYEAYHAYDWALKHGFTLKMVKKDINININEFE